MTSQTKARIRGPDGLLTPATIGHLRKVGSANMKGDEIPVISSKRALGTSIPIRHSPEADSAVWARMINAGTEGSVPEGKYFAIGLKEALTVAEKGTEEQRIDLADSTPHAAVQIALGRDKSPSVYDALISSRHLTMDAARSLASRAKIGENFSAAAYLEGRINEMEGNTVRILSRRAAESNKVSKRA